MAETANEHDSDAGPSITKQEAAANREVFVAKNWAAGDTVYRLLESEQGAEA